MNLETFSKDEFKPLNSNSKLILLLFSILIILSHASFRYVYVLGL